MYGTTLTDFLTDEDLQDIALRQFTVMGEAAPHVSDTLRRQYPQIDWRRATAFRNLIVHEYFRVDIYARVGHRRQRIATAGSKIAGLCSR